MGVQRLCGKGRFCECQMKLPFHVPHCGVNHSAGDMKEDLHMHVSQSSPVLLYFKYLPGLQ